MHLSNETPANETPANDTPTNETPSNDAPIEVILIPIPNNVPAYDLFKDGTKEHYLVAGLQFSAILEDPEKSSYQDVLTPQGLELFNLHKERYENGDHKNTLIDWESVRDRSGSWHPNKESPFYNEEFNMYCSWNNIKIMGTRQSDNKLMTTSIVVFLTDEWCSTKSGSIYKLMKN